MDEKSWKYEAIVGLETEYMQKSRIWEAIVDLDKAIVDPPSIDVKNTSFLEADRLEMTIGHKIQKEKG